MASYKGANRYGTAEPKPRPRNDAYTGLLIVSLLGMIASCVLLFVDWSNYSATAPPDYRKQLPPAAVPATPVVPKPVEKEPEKKDAPKAPGG